MRLMPPKNSDKIFMAANFYFRLGEKNRMSTSDCPNLPACSNPVLKSGARVSVDLDGAVRRCKQAKDKSVSLVRHWNFLTSCLFAAWNSQHIWATYTCNIAYVREDPSRNGTMDVHSIFVSLTGRNFSAWNSVIEMLQKYHTHRALIPTAWTEELTGPTWWRLCSSCASERDEEQDR